MMMIWEIISQITKIIYTRMKHLQFFENHIEQQALKDWAYEHAKDHHAGHNYYVDAVDELDYFFQHEFFEFFGDFKLYRVLQVESIDDIDVDKLGNHYLDTSYIERLYEKPWYESIGIELNDYEELFLVEVDANYDMVQWQHTIDSRLNFPREFEITLQRNPILSEISKIDQNLIK